MVKLSEILVSEKIEAKYFGVDVDEESFTPPDGLKQISFVLKENDGDIDETLMDVVISYAIGGVDVILEIPADVDGIDAKYYLSVAANSGISLSLLPPSAGTDGAAYDQRVSEFTKAYFQAANYSKMLYPVTSFLEYMFVETIDNVESLTPTDEYVLSRFVEPLAQDAVDSFKASIRAAAYDVFEDGESGFRNFAKALMHGIYKQVEENCKEAQVTQKG